MKITIDRIEGGVIVAELPDGATVDLPGALFPGAAEGDVYSIEKDEAEAGKREKRIKGKMDKLFTE